MKPKLLFISSHCPFPPRDGKRQRSLALVLASLKKYEVDYLILGNQSEYHLSFINKLEGLHFFFLPQLKEKIWTKKLGLSYIPNFENQRRIQEFLRGKDYARILCRYVLSAKDLPQMPHVLIDVDDDYSEVMLSKISFESSLFKKIRYWQIFVMNLPFYSRILKKSSHLIWVKPQMKPYLGSVLRNLPFQMLMDKDANLKEPNPGTILFLGKLSYAPNSKGIKWFLENVWPHIYEQNRNILLTLISTVAPESDLLALIRSSKGVSLKINVESLVAAYYQHAICIVPVFFGGGSNLKLAEALFMGRNVVSSPFGAKGFEVWAESDLVQIAKTPKEWEFLINNLLSIPWKKEDFIAVRKEFSLHNWNSEVLKVLDSA